MHYNKQIHTTGRMVAQTDGLLFSHWFFFSSKAHIPPWTASNSTGFKSPYSPDATSMTDEAEKQEDTEMMKLKKDLQYGNTQSVANVWTYAKWTYQSLPGCDR